MKIKTIILTLLIFTVLEAENYIIKLNDQHFENNINIKKNPELPKINERLLSLNFEDDNLNFSDFNLIKSNGNITEGIYRVDSLSTSSNGLAYEAIMDEGDKIFELQFDVKTLILIDSFPTMFTMGINNTMDVCIRWTRSTYGAYFFGDQELNSNVLLDGANITDWNTLKIIGDIENNTSKLYVNDNLKMEGNFPISTNESIFFSFGGGHNGCVASDNGIKAEFDNITASFK